MSFKKIWNFGNRLIAYAADFSRLHSWKKYSQNQWNNAKRNYEHWKPLSKEQKKEIIAFWDIRHPKKSDFLTHEIMMNVKGDFDVKYCPESTFRVNLDDDSLYRVWTDKNYYERYQPNLPLPYTYVRNINGVFLNHDYQPIGIDEVKKLIVDHLPLIIKPSLFSGEGNSIRLIATENEADEILTHYTKDYLIQEVIVQCDELKKLSPNSASSIRVITAMVDEKPVVLKTQLLCNTTDSVAVNASSAPGSGLVIIKINDDGTLCDHAYYDDAKELRVFPSGVSFAGLPIPSFDEAVNLALEAHKSMPMLGFIGWDVTIDKNHHPVFFEWNQRGTEIYHSQLTQGPLFGEFTDYFAKKVRNMKTRNK